MQKNAGYLDSAGTGQYKLNPVGYNLVVHRMGAGDEQEPRRGRKKGKAVKKTPRRKNR
jgi:hypothetical protein